MVYQTGASVFFQLDIVGVVAHHVKSDAFGLIKPLVRNGHPFDESKRGYPLVN